MTTEVQGKLQNFLEAQLPDAMSLLRQMVEINSFTANAAGVNQVGRLTAETFEPLGFEPQYIPCVDTRFGNHVVLRKKGTTSKTVGFVSHLDTVFPPEEEMANDFHWREEVHEGKTRIYGPGTVDIKGGTVVIHMMMSALAAVAPETFAKINWVILLNAAEEDFVDDFKTVCLANLPQKETLACLVFEGGRMLGEDYQLVASRKGMARFKISVIGRGAHAGSAHHAGASALLQMAEIVQKVSTLTDYDRDLTFNVGVMHSGTVVNRVPHFAEAEVEFRTFEEEVFTEALISMKSLEGYSTIRSAKDDFACQTHIEQTHHNEPWPMNDNTNHLLKMWQRAGQKLGREVWPEARGGLSDGNKLWDYVPTLDGLGPSGGNGHCSERTPDGNKDQEYAVKESFVPKALLNTLGLLELCRG